MSGCPSLHILNPTPPPHSPWTTLSQPPSVSHLYSCSSLPQELPVDSYGLFSTAGGSPPLCSGTPNAFPLPGTEGKVLPYHPSLPLISCHCRPPHFLPVLLTHFRGFAAPSPRCFPPQAITSSVRALVTPKGSVFLCVLSVSLCRTRSRP